jgi:hypothetical protein
LELAFGFVIAKRSSEADPLVAAILIEGLGKLLPEVRSILRRRPDPDRLKQFVGKRVWFAECPGCAAEGTINDAEGNTLMVSVEKTPHQSGGNTLAWACDLIVLEEEKSGGSITQAVNQKASEDAKRTVLINLLEEKYSVLREG